MECYLSIEPDVYSIRAYHARKEYKCCECTRAIKIGDSYTYTFGVWEGRKDVFRTCERCWDLWENFKALGYCVMHGDLMAEYQLYLDSIGSDKEACNILREVEG